ncbi:MAG: T9SS type A sorting domain-containing protein [candidate division Zixibacteria bacterium]|nr:T9SS type A sorting domain-containing protein [candidate division Zixibacteria bacterium]
MLCFIIPVLIFYAEESRAQETIVYVPNDTLKVMDATGQPGDTTIWVNVYLKNTYTAGGFSLRLRYDPNLIVPRETTVVIPPDSTDTWVVSEFAGRTTVPEPFDVLFFSTRIIDRNTGIATFVTVFDILSNINLPPGAGLVARLQFKVNPGITRDTATILLLENNPGYPSSHNVYVEPTGFITYKPTLTNGVFYISAGGPPGNNAPVFGTLASQFEVAEGQTLQFTVSASDQDGDIVTLSADALPSNATFPTITGDSAVSQTFSFSPDFTQGPDVISVTFRVRDEYGTSSLKTVTISITEGPPGNNAPVFGALVSQFEVLEGQTLSFTVSASDQDGDTVTLSADALPPNATFPAVKGDSTVSQTFSFSPDFTQGPGTISVTFRARDEHGTSSLKSVTITINEVPQDLLIVSSDQGGVPGSTGKLAPLIFTNLQDVYGVQFTLHFDSSAVQVDSFILAERINGFNINSNLGDNPNQVTVLIFGFGNEFIPSGSDTILYFVLSVDSLTLPGQKPLNLTNAREAIGIDLPSKELQVVDGFFTVDKFGDVNIDTLVDIADVVNLVAYILENISLNQRQTDAADINRDGDVNVGDLVGVINTILGRPINAPLERLSEPLAYLRLDYDSLVANSTGQIDVWADLKTEVSGAQLKIKYDPDQLSFSLPKLTSRSTGFNLSYKKDEENGILTLLFYRYYGEPIHSGQGNILSLPVITNSNFDKQKLELKEAILADTGGAVIPVDKGEVILPKTFSLSQNYPNPFNPTTTITFKIGSNGETREALQTTLKIYNILGQVAKTLVDEPKLPGIYHQIWDSKNEQGEKVSSGVYFYQLKVGDYNETKKMVLLK